jgi:hypothetical protein
MKKNEIFSFTGKWMELENIILNDVSRVQKIKNPRSRANAAMWLDLGHMTRGEHIREVWGYVENPKHGSV